jgi:hypothetical protein
MAPDVGNPARMPRAGLPRARIQGMDPDYCITFEYNPYEDEPAGT